MDCHPDGSPLALGTRDGRILIIETDLLTIRLDFDAHADAVTSLAWMPDGERLVSGSLDGLVRVWDPRSTRERESTDSAWRMARGAQERAELPESLEEATRRIDSIRRWVESSQNEPR